MPLSRLLLKDAVPIDVGCLEHRLTEVFPVAKWCKIKHSEPDKHWSSG